MKITHTKNFAKARAAEYPPIGDQLDAIWQALAGQKLPKETQDMLERIDAVKTKYPKPAA